MWPECTRFKYFLTILIYLAVLTMDWLPRQLIYLALNNWGMCRLFLVACYIMAVIPTGTLTCDILIVAMHVVFEIHAPTWFYMIRRGTVCQQWCFLFCMNMVEAVEWQGHCEGGEKMRTCFSM